MWCCHLLQRKKTSPIIGEMKVLGDVKGKDVVIIDDMVIRNSYKSLNLMMEQEIIFSKEAYYYLWSSFKRYMKN